MYPTFDEFMQAKNHTVTEALLVQAIAMLSTEPKYEHLTPYEVYDKVVDLAKDVQAHVSRVDNNVSQS